MVKTERRNMTVEYHVDILYFDEYIVDFMDEMSSEYIEESYPETYDSPAEYDIEIESDEIEEIVQCIINDTLNNLVCKIDENDEYKIIALLEDEIYSQIEQYDFDADTEILNLKISIEYDGNR